MRMRVTDKIGPKSFPYRTRMLQAGDEFDVRPGDETALRQLPFFEDVTDTAQTYGTRMMTAEPEPPRRRGRQAAVAAPAPGSTKAVKRAAAAVKADEYDKPAAAEAPAEPEPPQTGETAGDDDPYPEQNVHELRQMAIDRGIELPSGYVTRDELIRLLQQAGG